MNLIQFFINFNLPIVGTDFLLSTSLYISPYLVRNLTYILIMKKLFI